MSLINSRLRRIYRLSRRLATLIIPDELAVKEA
jgi:hypothetical protein